MIKRVLKGILASKIDGLFFDKYEKSTIFET